MAVSDNDLRSLSDGEWLDHLGGYADDGGFMTRLGARHTALYVDDGPVLIVTFETIAGIRRRDAVQLPFGLRVAGRKGWSHLCLIADGETWYRDRAVYGLFDRLVDDAFFEDFDQVVFYGAGMAGYAAAAFSVSAPGATVVAVQPQASLDPAVAGWDPRFPHMRRVSFTDRYGFAPEMTEGAGPVFVLFDPFERLDAMHAALFARPWTTLLPCRYFGAGLAGALEEMGVTTAILHAAGTGTFDARLFSTFLRARRNFQPYLRGLTERLDRDGRPYLNALLCRNVAERLRNPRFQVRLAELEAELRAEGVRLPRRG